MVHGLRLDGGKADWYRNRWVRSAKMVESLGEDLAGRTLGGWDRVRAATPMRAYWKRVWHLTGMPFPNPMHLMLQSTNPLGTAVKAAERQGEVVADAVLRRFREHIFVFGIGPQTREEFVSAAKGVPGLDIARWLGDIELPEVVEAYRKDWQETREPNDWVRNLKHDSPMNG